MQEIVAPSWLLAMAPQASVQPPAWSAPTPVADLERSRAGFKGMLSESGWVYLVNDTNQFLGSLYGESQWKPGEGERAIATLRKRRRRVAASGASYLKFIVPEKPVVYPEYLPKALRALPQSASRPALQLAQALPEFVTYCGQSLLEAKAYGLLYFRGDSHPNWLGSYFIYREVITRLRMAGAAVPAPIAARDLKASLYRFDGDVYGQLGPADSERLAANFSDLQFPGGFECGVKYELDPAACRATSTAPKGALADMEFSRELIITEVDDPSLPSAVIFRDSTCDRVVPLLAEHFRRAVFVWHRGEVVGDVLELERPEVVLHIMAERFVVSYGRNMVPISSMPQRAASASSRT